MTKHHRVEPSGATTTTRVGAELTTTIDEEKAANVFLRADVPAVAAAVGRAGKPAAEVFTEVRARKNKF